MTERVIVLHMPPHSLGLYWRAWRQRRHNRLHRDCGQIANVVEVALERDDWRECAIGLAGRVRHRFDQWTDADIIAMAHFNRLTHQDRTRD